jgi:hypothetical protein
MALLRQAPTSNSRARQARGVQNRPVILVSSHRAGYVYCSAVDDAGAGVWVCLQAAAYSAGVR